MGIEPGWFLCWEQKRKPLNNNFLLTRFLKFSFLVIFFCIFSLFDLFSLFLFFKYFFLIIFFVLIFQFRFFLSFINFLIKTCWTASPRLVLTARPSHPNCGRVHAGPVGDRLGHWGSSRGRSWIISGIGSATGVQCLLQGNGRQPFLENLEFGFF